MENNLKVIEQKIIEKPTEFSIDRLIFLIEKIKKEELKSQHLFKNSIIFFKSNFQTNSISGICKSISKENGKFTLHINDESLIGFNSILPSVYSEKIGLLQKEKHTLFLDFLNLFNHRFLFFKYLILKQNSINLSENVLKHLKNIVNVKKEQKYLIALSNIFLQKQKNSENLKIALNYLFNANIHINSFQKSKIKIDENAKFALNYQKLDKKILGNYSNCYYKKIQIIVKFKTLYHYNEFLPFQKKFEIVRNFLYNYLGNSFKVEIIYEIKKDAKKASKLNKKSYLGLNFFIGTSKNHFGSRLSL